MHPHTTPDYELDDEVIASTPAQMKALGNEVRFQILDLVLERAATVTELAASLDRPRGSIAHHVDVLVDAGLLRVVRTRKVRAIEERFYGRTGRTVRMIASPEGIEATPRNGFLTKALHDSRNTPGEHVLATLRHARIPADRAGEFFDAVVALAEDFTRLERGGDTVWGFVASVYATELPSLPDPEERS